MAYPTVSAPYGLKPINLIGGQVFGDEILIDQCLGHQCADRLLAGRRGVRLQRGADIGAELFQSVGHVLLPRSVLLRHR